MSQAMSGEQQNGHVFVGGAGRSGTTLMRVLLDAHRRICCGPELKVLPYVSELYQLTLAMGSVTEAYGNTLADVQGCFRQFVESLSANFRRASGKPRWAEKTPHNVLSMAPLGTMFPDARFIHVIRDGRDVACSLVTMDWFDPRTGAKRDYVQNVAKAAGYWRRIVQHARQQAADPALAGRVIEVRYEALVADVEGIMRQVLDFLGEAWDPAILEAHKKSRAHEPRESSTDQATKPIYDTSIGRWKRDMSPADRIAFKSEAGPLLKELGYAPEDW
ncbi:MAG: sulfotransferase [Tepidisphaeraceae bacterium]